MSEVPTLISDLAVILIAAGIVTVLFKWLKQPVILGYIVAGMLTGPSISFLPTVTDSSNIQTWADIGVIFLLFAMGLEFSFKKLMNVGMTAIVATITIVCGMMFLGYTAGNAMGFSHMSSIFLGGMLAMSSTAIVFKAFNDMNMLQQRFTGIVLGILVVEDLVGVVMLVMLSTLAVSKHFEGGAMLGSVLKLAAFLVFWSVLGIYLLPTLLKKLKKYISNEILLIASLGLCLGMVMIATHAGFSSALGAFVMGSLLAETVEAEQIARIVQPVKDLFAAIFFVSVGMMIDLHIIWQYMVPILVLTLLVLAGQVFFGSLGVILSGQPLKIAIQSGFSLTQVGEFSFIIASLGVSLKVTDNYLYPVIVAVSVITTFLTPYMIRLSDPAYRFVDKHLPPFMKELLVRYTSGTMTTRHVGTWHKLLRDMVLQTAVYIIICITFCTLFFSFAQPFISQHLHGLKGDLLSFVIIFLILSPLLWGILTCKDRSTEFRKLWDDNKFNRAPLISLIIIRLMVCTAIIMSVLTHLFNVAIGAGLVFTAVIIGFLYISKWARKRYLTIEEQFMQNFQGSSPEEISDERKELEGSTALELKDSTPFKNLHLTEFTINPDSVYVGKSLRDAEIRTLFQVNVISIVRGDMHIDIPEGNECLYPFDKITVAGTDDKLEAFRKAINQVETDRIDTGAEDSGSRMTIAGVPVDGRSPLLNHSIHQLDLKGCIVMGLERKGENIMNPTSDTVFQENDTVWMVGKAKAIKAYALPAKA